MVKGRIVMATLKSISNELKERLLDRDVEVGDIEIEDGGNVREATI